MSLREVEKKFENYREKLLQELMHLACYIRLYRRLHERRTDRLAEMNVAPAFFQIITDALFSSIVLWVDKILGHRSERGLVNFLSFIESNLKIFTISELQRRKDYPNGHWMLQRDPIFLETINSDREKIKAIEALKSFKVRRDKFHAHFDKKYFFNLDKLSEDSPIVWGDLEKVLEVSTEIINTYSAAYDGNLYVTEPMNATDVDVVLDIINKHKIRNKN
jgi:hypothetical protein